MNQFKFFAPRFIAALVLLLLLAIASERYFFRIDLTAEKRYSLHPETISLLESLPKEVFVKVYLDGPDLPPNFKRMQRDLREMLQQFDRYAGRQFAYTFLNPTESADKNVRFALYKELHLKGLSPIEATQETSQGKTEQLMVFPGAILSCDKRELGINLLKTDSRFRLDGPENIQNSVQAFEYELTNAIRKLITEQKPRIAFLEGHGELPEYNVLSATQALSEYYEVQRGAIGGKNGILDTFEALIVAQPTTPFSKADKYVIDQYIMQGGKVLWLVDGVQHQIDTLSQADVVAIVNDINLMDQLFRYGARVNPDLVQDLQCAPIGLTRPTNNGRPRIQAYPWPYFPVLVSENEHVVSKYLPPVRTEYLSSVDTVGDNPKVHKSVLLHSSKFSKISAVPVQLNLNDALKPIDQTQFGGKPVPVAVLLEGEFESAFLNRPIQDVADNVAAFRSKSIGTKMIVIGTGSLLRNELSAKGEVIPMGFDQHARKLFAGNRELLLNALNYLTDDRGLMSIRNREITMRLLDKQRLVEERSQWQLLNVALPLALLLLVGLAWQWIRRWRFARQIFVTKLS